MTQLRVRSVRMKRITKEEWSQVDSIYQELLLEFLNGCNSLQTKKQYESRLKQFGVYIKNKLNNKSYYKITKRDMRNFILHLVNEKNMSSGGANLYKSSISSFNNYIESFIVGEEGYEDFDSFRNFTRGLKPISKTTTYEVKTVSREEYSSIIEYLKKDDRKLELAYISTLKNSGFRRNAIRQLLTSDILKAKDNDKLYIETSPIKDKGGSDRYNKYLIRKEALPYLLDWINNRGYDDKYVFTLGDSDNVREIYENWGNILHKELSDKVVGRRINPHIWKHTIVTDLIKDGVDKKVVSEFIAHHKDISTTEIYDNNDYSNLKDTIF